MAYRNNTQKRKYRMKQENEKEVMALSNSESSEVELDFEDSDLESSSQEEVDMLIGQDEFPVDVEFDQLDDQCEVPVTPEKFLSMLREVDIFKLRKAVALSNIDSQRYIIKQKDLLALGDFDDSRDNVERARDYVSRGVKASEYYSRQMSIGANPDDLMTIMCDGNTSTYMFGMGYKEKFYDVEHLEERAARFPTKVSLKDIVSKTRAQLLARLFYSSDFKSIAIPAVGMMEALPPLVVEELQKESLREKDLRIAVRRSLDQGDFDFKALNFAIQRNLGNVKAIRGGDEWKYVKMMGQLNLLPSQESVAKQLAALITMLGITCANVKDLPKELRERKFPDITDYTKLKKYLVRQDKVLVVPNRLPSKLEAKNKHGEKVKIGREKYLRVFLTRLVEETEVWLYLNLSEFPLVGGTGIYLENYHPLNRNGISLFGKLTFEKDGNFELGNPTHLEKARLDIVKRQLTDLRSLITGRNLQKRIDRYIAPTAVLSFTRTNKFEGKKKKDDDSFDDEDYREISISKEESSEEEFHSFEADDEEGYNKLEGLSSSEEEEDDDCSY